MKRTTSNKPVVIIISEEAEMSTDTVIEWIYYLGGRPVRINGRQFLDEAIFEFSLHLSNATHLTYSISLHGECFTSDEIRSVWFRRDEAIRLPDYLDAISDRVLQQSLKQSVAGELLDMKQSIQYALSQKFRIGGLHNKTPNKFEVLHKAGLAGLDIPASLYTNKKSELMEFKQKHQRIINKAIGNLHQIKDSQDHQWGGFTKEVTAEDIENTDELFGASCFQELLEKEFEVRTFYLFGKTYSMAIFSQNDTKTQIDFRHYNSERPNRNIPYKLPLETDKKLSRLMELLQLNTGSVDFVKTADGRLVFLEINPVGQYGMTSQPCNYSLDKIIAHHLLHEAL